MELTAAEVWSRILDEARAALPEQAFRTWLAPTEAIAFSQDTLIVSTPNPFAADWVEDKYAELLTAIGGFVALSVPLAWAGSLVLRAWHRSVVVPAPTPAVMA